MPRPSSAAGAAQVHLRERAAARADRQVAARGNGRAARAHLLVEMPLRDVLTSRPRILFVGINPGLRSEALGHHFAGRGNPFWRLLQAAQLIPEAFTHEDDTRLPSCGLALTNIVPRATRAASELTRSEFEAGRAQLARVIARVKPEIVAFVGV